MADAADIAAELHEEAVARGVAEARRALPFGEPGECDRCGEDMPRLIDGVCVLCTDGRRRVSPDRRRVVDIEVARRVPAQGSLAKAPVEARGEEAPRVEGASRPAAGRTVAAGGGEASSPLAPPPASPPLPSAASVAETALGGGQAAAGEFEAASGAVRPGRRDRRGGGFVGHAGVHGHPDRGAGRPHAPPSPAGARGRGGRRAGGGARRVDVRRGADRARARGAFPGAGR